MYVPLRLGFFITASHRASVSVFIAFPRIFLLFVLHPWRMWGRVQLRRRNLASMPVVRPAESHAIFIFYCEVLLLELHHFCQLRRFNDLCG